jgi:hypothetical protein
MALLVGVTAGIVILAGVAVMHITGGGSDDGAAAGLTQEPMVQVALPDFILASDERVAMAYQFALERPDVMLWMPCYCGCGGHSGHKNARDCFVQPESSPGNVQFEEHGSQCDVCVDISLLAREMTLAGRSLSEIRTAVDQEFGDVGPGTDTPLPPG